MARLIVERFTPNHAASTSCAARVERGCRAAQPHQHVRSVRAENLLAVALIRHAWTVPLGLRRVDPPGNGPVRPLSGLVQTGVWFRWTDTLAARAPSAAILRH